MRLSEKAIRVHRAKDILQMRSVHAHTAPFAIACHHNDALAPYALLSPREVLPTRSCVVEIFRTSRLATEVRADLYGC